MLKVQCIGASRYSAVMRHILHPHPNFQGASGTAVEAEVGRQQNALSLRYFVYGKGLHFPFRTAPTRADELWRHTCFEAFVRPTSGTEYYEFNFAPSTQWAAYRFVGYRAAMSLAELTELPVLHVRSADGHFELTARIALDGLPDLRGDEPWKIGLSTVIEDTTGSLSYWALTHPPGRPDFHHADCFSLKLPAA